MKLRDNQPNIRTEVLHNPIHTDHSYAKQVSKSVPNNFATLIMEPDWRKDRDSSIQLWVELHKTLNDLCLIIVGSPLTEKESKLILNFELFNLTGQKIKYTTNVNPRKYHIDLVSLNNESSSSEIQRA